jgi:CheY-like chemotaxis protein
MAFKARILIVEDKEGFRAIYRDRLISDGYEVLEAFNGTEGLQILNAEHIDAVITDIIMPEMGGYELLDAMASNPKLQKIPVIILSVLGDTKDIQKGLEHGASDYLVKGMYTPNNVLSKVGALLAQHKIGAFAQKYTLSVHPQKHDSVKITQDLGFTDGWVCNKCGKERRLELIPQTTHVGWFDARVVCDCSI